MDSLTQAVLGAGVGVAVAGRRLGPRKAALVGAALGTIPDLDVLYSHGDPVSDFVLHRGATHSLLVHALVTPLFGEALMRLLAGLRERRWTAYALVFLCFATHALLDAVTVYGTQLLWPVSTHPFGIGSVFIIDPLYTLPLLILAVWAICRRHWSPGIAGVTAAALAVSTGYLGWSVAGQQIAGARAETALTALGIAPERSLATPAPFNTLFWRVIAIDGDRYLNVYVPLLGDPDALTIHSHRRLPAAGLCIDDLPAAETVARFSKGFYRIALQEDVLRIGDLRMGLTPSFVFDFAVAEQRDGVLVPIRPQRVSGARGQPGDLDWLLTGLGPTPTVRPAEREALLDAPPVRAAAAGRPAVRTC